MIKIFLIAGCLFNSQFVFATRTNFDAGDKFSFVLSNGLRDVSTGLQPIKPFALINQTLSELSHLKGILNTDTESGGFVETAAVDRNRRINQEYYSIGKMLTNSLKKNSEGVTRLPVYPEINTWYTIGAWASFSAGKVIASKVDILQVDATCEGTKDGKPVNYCLSNKMNHEVTKVFCNVTLAICLVPIQRLPDSIMVEGGAEYVEKLIDKNYFNSKIILKETQNVLHPFVNGSASALVDGDVRRWFAAGNFIIASELIQIGRHFLREFCVGSFYTMEEDAKESKRNLFF